MRDIGSSGVPPSEARAASGDYQPQLDALRALAVTTIVVTHVAFQTGHYLDGAFAAELARLDIGVALFFVLSGYLLARAWLAGAPPGRTGPRLSGYFWRRLLRLAPAYVVAVVLALVVIPANSSAKAGDWWRHLTFTQVYGGGHLLPGLTQTWSLATEAAFYLALPVIARLVAPAGPRTPLRRVVARLAVLEAVSLGWIALVASSDSLQRQSASTWLPGYLGWFGAGMVLCALSVDAERGSDRHSRTRAWLAGLSDHPWGCWTTAIGLFLIASTPAAGPRTLDPATGWQAVTKHLLYGAIGVLVLLPAAGPGGVTGLNGRVLESAPLRFVGRVSYGVFLYHLVVLDVLFRAGHLTLFDRRHFLLVAVVTWTTSVVLAWASYRWIELPALRRRSLVGMWSREPATRSPTAQAPDSATRLPEPR